MQQNKYPDGTVSALLNTDLVLPQTKAVLQQRIDKSSVTEPLFFSPADFDTLKAVCNRLIPQTEHAPIDLAGLLDADLAKNIGNGWRYNTMPPDQESFTKGMAGINETAQVLWGKKFTEATAEQQDMVLKAIQKTNVSGNSWQQLPPHLFFEELLSRLSEIYYSHPLAKDSIGDVSFADAHGWQRIQLNEKEIQEPQPILQNPS